jgi:cytochrome c553
MDGFTVSVVLILLLSSGARADGLAEKIEICTVCHGAAGLPDRADIPIIWGQEYYYLYVQLKDYKAGRRHNAQMSGIAATLTRQEMKDLAQHFSSQAWPAIVEHRASRASSWPTWNAPCWNSRKRNA